MKYCRIVICFLCVILLHPCRQAGAQSPYRIVLPKSTAALDTGFLKMGTNVAPNGDRLSYNNQYLTKNNRPWYPIMGELHYSRVRAADWETTISKMKSGGINIIATYVFWNHIEDREGVFNWEGKNNLRAFLALCKKHGMYVWLRPGPWVHAEARNGGFPDWLLKKGIGLRKNDSTYLTYANHFFTEIAKQCDGYWFKQNGTVIGIQIENELDFRSKAALAHMLKLKEIAKACGMDVPYYSAFGQGPDDQSDFLYMMGSYPDSPWAQGTNKLIKPIFFIKPLEADRDIGADLLGKVDGKVRNTYPKISAEIGGGMQVTYHRRTEVSAMDIAVNAFTKIAGGLNGMGYYMFAGGINPSAQTLLQESRLTNYPNDVPLLNYDFQAPIGAMGIMNDSYSELRLQHLFLNDFGSALATMPASFPLHRKMLTISTDTVQLSIREKDNSGFIFLSNFQRNVAMPAVNRFNITVKTAEGNTEQIPNQPVTFPADSYAVWPYNLPIGGVILHYATAQPLCVLHNKEKETYVFYSQTESEFVFETSTLQKITDLNNARIINSSIKCPAGKIASFTITDKQGIQAGVIVLPKQLALQVNKQTLNNKEVLLIADASIVVSNGMLDLEKVAENGLIKLMVYPDIKFKPANNLFTCTPFNQDGVFAVYQLKPLKQVTGKATIVLNRTFTDSSTSVSYRDSLLAELKKHKTFKADQPGPLYGLQFHNLPGQKVYDVRFAGATNSIVTDWEATINYDADLLAIYTRDKLTYDQFNYNDSCKIRLSYFNTSRPLQLQLLPLPSGANIYVEDDMKNQRDKAWQYPLLKSITVKPVMHYQLIAQ